jgi:uncharacterized membrane protein affecting hemolysin expression
MSAIRREVLEYICVIPDSKLEALKPILSILADESVVIEADLTDEERHIVARGREEHKRGRFALLEEID